jgi:hypothetical protein
MGSIFFFMVFSKAPKVMVFFFLVFSKTPWLWLSSSWPKFQICGFFSKAPKALVFFFLVFFQNSMAVVFFLLAKTSTSWSCSSWFFPKLPKPFSSYWLYLQSHGLLLKFFKSSQSCCLLFHGFFQSSQSCVLIHGFFSKIPWMWFFFS